MAEQKSIGALWIRKSKSGADYMTGILELSKDKAVKIVAFVNNYKKSEKHPDWRIFIQAPKPEKEEEANQEALNTIEKDDENEIPF